MKKILLIATGGTIASRDKGQGLTPDITPGELLDFAPAIRKLCILEAVQVMNIDSLRVQPEDWLIMAKAVEDNYEAYDGFIVAHGTDTLAYTAAALSYLIQRPGKPVIVTGSQKPMDEPGSDGPKNLLDSVRAASSGLLWGVYIVFAGKIIAGTRGRKICSKSFTAFESVNFPDVGFAGGREILLYNKIPFQADPAFYRRLDPDVCLLKLTPGTGPDLLLYAAAQYSGIVIESYGAGGLPDREARDFLSAFERVLQIEGKNRRSPVVVIGTQVAYEGTDMMVTEIGRKALRGVGKASDKHSVMETLDMTVECAVVKLMWLLGEYGHADNKTIHRLFYEPIHYDILRNRD